MLSIQFMANVKGMPINKNEQFLRRNENTERFLMERENDLNVLESLIKNQSSDYESDEDEDYSSKEEEEQQQYAHFAKSQQEEEQILREREQNEQLKFIQSDKYRDYAFDTTDTDQFNEEDDLLRKYYGHQTRSASYGDYDSFSDVMHLAAEESERESEFIQRLHYGYANDQAADDEYDYISADYVN